ncbi:hypothetical protein [Plantactinospora endophytica]|uniref:Cysteine dioxygenase n=1 Tax=Plantactinospora endophytica TaxID=673535 RepID=A0ABQ4E8B9_9ACTN|nr:hypothetical protein [Plantactinospora endophytica]GIG90963.1 hypothetical protein Pen02_58990 [Plantactinospora endophytica]
MSNTALLRETEDRLRCALVAGDGKSGDADESLLRELGTPAALSSFLAAMARDAQWAAQVSERSHKHALGFDKFILATFGDLGQLRMHVWWPGVDRRREHVHNHRYDFSSVLVAGDLRCHYFGLAETGERMVRLKELSRVEDGGWRFEKVGVETVTQLLDVRLAAGSCYSMPADLLHRIEAGRPTTVSLMLQRRLCRDWSTVLVGVTEQVPERLPLRRFSTADLHERVAALQGCLRGL